MLVPGIAGCILLALTIICSGAAAHNILVLTPITTPSHSNVFKPLVAELADRGHFVTYWNGLLQSDKSSSVIQSNQTTTNSSNMRLLTSPNLVRLNSQHQIDFNDRDSPFRLLFRMPGTLEKYCKAIYEDPIFHWLMNSKERYDLIILDGFSNDCTLLLAEVFDVPFIYLNCFPPSPWLLYAIGSPLALDHFPNPAGTRDKMDLWQRTFNTVTSVGALFIYRWHILPMIDRVASQVLGKHNLTSIVDIQSRHLSLLMTNTHFSINFQFPTSPAVVEVGGLHLGGKLKRLPKDLVSFLDGSGDAGFIIVSFGSMLRGDGLPKDFRRLFLSVFARLPQRIVWKWEDQSKLGNGEELIPSNVKTISWLPQKELLSHRNARLFISHGGLLSKQETVFHGVPAIFLPVWADQPINAQKAEDDGYAIRLCWDELTEEILYDAIQAILTNPRYAKRMQQVSALMHDQIDKPMDRAIYWIEYVIRHQGAPHLRNASRDLMLPQRALLDVMCIVFIFTFSMIYVTYRLCLFCSTLYRWKDMMIGLHKKDD
ncbi:UDP-glycosyltransferase UGT5-like [Daphnia pulicaria]|uniref:UDP-glycosyltransferase UGT5-like n=1 Tax=Daphnia pulicaria TaxID=35523 RepID=UPI001EECCCB3|nr:UDP-glycosyltransferase UGT5-like [Daphnia pulicaria]